MDPTALGGARDESIAAPILGEEAKTNAKAATQYDAPDSSTSGCGAAQYSQQCATHYSVHCLESRDTTIDSVEYRVNRWECRCDTCSTPTDCSDLDSCKYTSSNAAAGVDGISYEKTPRYFEFQAAVKTGWTTLQNSGNEAAATEQIGAIHSTHASHRSTILQEFADHAEGRKRREAKKLGEVNNLRETVKAGGRENMLEENNGYCCSSATGACAENCVNGCSNDNTCCFDNNPSTCEDWSLPSGCSLIPYNDLDALMGRATGLESYLKSNGYLKHSAIETYIKNEIHNFEVDGVKECDGEVKTVLMNPGVYQPRYNTLKSNYQERMNDYTWSKEFMNDNDFTVENLHLVDVEMKVNGVISNEGYYTTGDRCGKCYDVNGNVDGRMRGVLQLATCDDDKVIARYKTNPESGNQENQAVRFCNMKFSPLHLDSIWRKALGVLRIQKVKELV